MSGSEGKSSSRWIPLESNPEVLTEWAVKAGLVPTQAHFEDIYGLDTELLGMVSQPVKAVILLFPITAAYEQKRREEDERIETQGQHAIDPTVFWMKQTISNACGTMALLHALINSDVTFRPDSPIEKFIEMCKDITPLERAKILETTPLFADIHADAASGGQTAVPTDLDTDLHFTCFVQAPSPPAREDGTPATSEQMRVLELDGRRAGPVDRGQCKDFLKDVAKIVKDNYIAHTASMQFSLIALSGGPALD
ncbi:cysteine proteinase [Lentinus tigrinus ALCF2SS1-7]|uniref:Ubiquitin carboxyl-terminal hydrolase n=1 Tax=Lentinus tigrinus ALCF2SS1-6 TaxID=1328759 RepID=A0A5C2SMM3_9APHY|nr:cysteine proteinase [Lentinus tigrinus ALCF2SS1-6]RPD76548.1 cysteine proteinase [Lentinus tigrinus ALCF2SS1-7]